MPDKQQYYKLQYLPLFWDDLNETVTYIADKLKNPRAAERFLDQVETEILKHLKNPTIAPVYHSAKQRPTPYYWFSVGNYMVFYVVFNNTMEVRRLLYGSRDLATIIS